MKNVIFSFIFLFVNLLGTRSLAQVSNLPNLWLDEPVIIHFESGNQTSAMIYQVAIDPRSGVYQFQFKADLNDFPQGTVVEGFVDDKIVGITLVSTGESIVGPNPSGSGSSADAGAGTGQGSGNGVGNIIGGAVGEGLVAAGVTTLVAVLSAGQSPMEVFKKINKLNKIVKGLMKAYANHLQRLQTNGTVNTGIVNQVQDRQREAFEQGLQNQKNIPTVKTGDQNMKARIEQQWNRYRDIRTRNVQEARLKTVGQDFLENADELSSRGEKSAAELSLRYAIDIADVLVGIDPITGTIRNVYELYTGHNLVTGKELTSFQRNMAAVGLSLNLMSFGAGGAIFRVEEALGKVFRGAEAAQAVQAATKTVELLGNSPSVASRSGMIFSEMKVVDSMIEGTLNQSEKYFRFYNKDSSRPMTEWISQHALHGKPISYVVDGLTLPGAPAHFTMVEVATGTKVRFGLNPSTLTKPEGVIQHQILKESGGYLNIRANVPLEKVMGPKGTFDVQAFGGR